MFPQKDYYYGAFEPPMLVGGSSSADPRNPKPFLPGSLTRASYLGPDVLGKETMFACSQIVLEYRSEHSDGIEFRLESLVCFGHVAFLL